jgi:bacteriocin-like protein
LCNNAENHLEIKKIMENKTLMLQASHPTEYTTGKRLPEFVELSENDLQQIVGGRVKFPVMKWPGIKWLKIKPGIKWYR